jgi:hypothetical protein
LRVQDFQIVQAHRVICDGHGAVDHDFIADSAAARAKSLYGADCRPSDVAYWIEKLTGMAEAMSEIKQSSAEIAKIIKVIDEIGPIPNDVIAVRADLPAPIVSRVRDTLLKMSVTDDGKARLKEIFNADGFAPASDDDFAPVRTLRAFMDRAQAR